MTTDKTQLVYELFIRTTPEELWQALTDASFTSRYFFGTTVESSFRPGEPIKFALPNGQPAVEGEIIACDPPRRLAHTWVIQYDEALSKESSRVTHLIQKRGAACKLTVLHDIEGAPGTAKHVGKDGWTVILSGLKTLLETGEVLVVGPMAE